MSNHITFPEFKMSRQFATSESIKKYTGTPHGLTLAVLSLIDKINKDLTIELACIGESQLHDFSTQINNILHRSEVIKVYFRSIKINGMFQESKNNIKLEQDDTTPTSSEQYKNKSHVICDIEIDGDGQKWKFWRNPENMPRILTLIVK
mgnify:CR=1 FL=1